MGLFRSIGKWFKALGYLLTGRLDSARDVLDTNPHAIRAKYDDIIRDKVKRIQQYKTAVATLIAQEEKKLGTVKRLTDEVEKLEDLKMGAAAKAKQIVATLQGQGKTTEQIHGDAEYQKCLGAFNDFTATLEEKQARIVELEESISEYRKTVGDHKVQLQQLLREIDNLKVEAAETVADMITAKEEKEISDMITGIADEGTAEELQNLRDLRQRVKAEGRISKELAGTETKSQEREFLEYARKSASTSEFDELIGLSAETESADGEAPAKDTRLPE